MPLAGTIVQLLFFINTVRRLTNDGKLRYVAAVPIHVFSWPYRNRGS